MPRIVKVEYERVKNLGNYTTERVNAVVEVDEGDDPNRAMMVARCFVYDHLGLTVTDQMRQMAQEA